MHIDDNINVSTPITEEDVCNLITEINKQRNSEEREEDIKELNLTPFTIIQLLKCYDLQFSVIRLLKKIWL